MSAAPKRDQDTGHGWSRRIVVEDQFVIEPADETATVKTCAHCGRRTGDYPGGYASAYGLDLCHPNEPGRPDCYHLVISGQHRRGERCPDCMPPMVHDTWGRSQEFSVYAYEPTDAERIAGLEAQLAEARAEVDAMRPVVEAAVAWRERAQSALRAANSSSPLGALRDAVDVYSAGRSTDD